MIKKSNTIYISAFLISLTVICCGKKRNEANSEYNYCSKVPESVIQAFLNDTERPEKIKRYDLNFACDNILETKSIDVDGLICTEYQLPSECGGCINYKILTFGERKTFATPINIELLLVEFSEMTKADSTGTPDRILAKKLSNFVALLNTFISELDDNDSLSHKKAISKKILNEFVFNTSLKAAVKEFNLDVKGYGLEEYLNAKTSNSYYWINGAVFMVDWDNSTVKKPINLTVLNLENYYNLKY